MRGRFHVGCVSASPPNANSACLQAESCRFVLVEDQPLLRDLLSDTLRQRFNPADFRAFPSGREGVAHCLAHPVDILLVDLGLPDIDGREVIRQVRSNGRKPRIVVLTAQVDHNLPAELVALGVAGFVDKAAPLEHAVRAVERVLAGGMYFFAGVMPGGSGIALRATSSRVGPSVLTARERDVVRLVVGGLSSKEIAQRLELSPRTVENYRANLMQKIGVRDTASLVRWGLEHGLG